MNKSNIQTLNIEKALSKSSYPVYTKNFIEEYLIKNYSNNKETKVYLTSVSQQNLFVIEYILPIYIEKNRIININILIYLPILFPNYSPEFYISKKGNFGISDEYENSINKKNLRINLDYFVPFNPISKNVEEIINSIRDKFSKDFPIYKTNDNNIEQTGKCVLDKNKCFLILFQNNNVINNIINNENKIKDSFNDKQFMNFIRKQTKDILRDKYMIFKEEFNIESNLDKLKKSRKAINKNSIKSNNNNELEKEKEKLIKLKNNLNDILRKNEKSIFDQVSNYIKIENKKVFELIIIKKAMLDYLAFLKKGFQKNIVSFEEMKNKTRKLSREIFNINYTINKLNYIK